MPRRRASLRLERLEHRALLAFDLVPLGTFGLVESTPVVSTGEATSAAIADFNRDGIQDLAFGTSHARAFLDDQEAVVGIALGDGEFGFNLHSDQRIHDDVVTVIAADVNGDGYDDIIAGGIYRLSILLSETNELGEWIGLSEPRYIGGASERIVLEDFDRNGTLDIATTAKRQWFPRGVPSRPSVENRDLEGVYIYEGDGVGGFNFIARFSGTEDLIGNDFDGDGDIDLLARQVERDQESHGVVLINNSNDEIAFEVGDTLTFDDFQSRIEQPTYDINGDELPDTLETQEGYDWGIVNTPTETVYRLGLPDGTFDRPILLTDLFYGNWQQFELGTPASFASSAAPFVLDVDQNGANDFVHIRGKSIRIVRQRIAPSGFANSARNYPSASDRLYYSNFYDINGDGLLDYVAHSGYDHFAEKFEDGRHVQYGLPRGEFAPSIFMTEAEIQGRFETHGIEEFNNDIRRGDLNSDGLLDKVERITNGPDRIVVCLANDHGGFSESQTIQGNIGPVELRDFNNDSHLDLLVWQRESVGTQFRYDRYLMLGEGNGEFLPRELYDGPLPPVTQHHNGGVSVTVLELSSEQWSYDVPEVTRFQIPIQSQWRTQIQTAGPSHDELYWDVDYDGDLDVVIGHGSGVAVVLGVGEGDFNEDGSLTMADFKILAQNYGTSNASPAQGDVDGNGKVDFKDFLTFAKRFPRN